MKYGQRWRDAPEYHLLDRVPLGRPCPPPIYTPSPLHPFSSPVDNFRSCIFSITRLGWMDLDSFPILPDSPIISIILELDVWRRRTFLVILSWLVLINKSKKIFFFCFFLRNFEKSSWKLLPRFAQESFFRVAAFRIIWWFCVVMRFVKTYDSRGMFEWICFTMQFLIVLFWFWWFERAET